MRALIPLLFLAACQGDESLTAYGADGTWVLSHINDAAFKATATITFSDEGRVSGNAPCNSYAAQQTAPYPWFDLSQIIATRRACPQLSDEADFFKTLSAMTLAEVSGDVLILSNDDAETMLFTKQLTTQPDG